MSARKYRTEIFTSGPAVEADITALKLVGWLKAQGFDASLVCSRTDGAPLTTDDKHRIVGLIAAASETPKD